MKSVLEASAYQELQQRLNQLTPESQRRWGKMDVAQMMAHVSNVLEIAVADKKPPRSLLGYLLGGFVKKSWVDDSPISHNSPTDSSIKVTTPKQFGAEKVRIKTLLERLNKGGATGVTTHPHPFFGPLTPDEWGKLQYKYLNHHLEQFGV